MIPHVDHKIDCGCECRSVQQLLACIVLWRQEDDDVIVMLFPSASFIFIFYSAVVVKILSSSRFQFRDNHPYPLEESLPPSQKFADVLVTKSGMTYGQ